MIYLKTTDRHPYNFNNQKIERTKTSKLITSGYINRRLHIFSREHGETYRIQKPYASTSATISSRSLLPRIARRGMMWGYEVTISAVRATTHNSKLFVGRVSLKPVPQKPNNLKPTFDKVNKKVSYFYSPKETFSSLKKKGFKNHPNFQKAVFGEKATSAVRLITSEHSIDNTRILIQDELVKPALSLDPYFVWNPFVSGKKLQLPWADVIVVHTDVNVGQESTQESLELASIENPAEGKNFPKQSASAAERLQEQAKWAKNIESGTQTTPIDVGQNEIKSILKSAVSITPDGIDTAEQGKVGIPDGYDDATYLSPENTFTQKVLENLGGDE